MSQKQVGEVFESLWNNIYSKEDIDNKDYELGIVNDNKKLMRWSDNKIPSWIENINTNSDKINILDAGCGGGYGIKSIMELCKTKLNKYDEILYTGIDLIEIENPRKNIERNFQKNFDSKKIKVKTKQIDMNNSKELGANFNLVMALGSLHHTPSVENSLNSTFYNLRSEGVFLGWIINKQKPLRALTDSFFREYFQKFSKIEECEQEIRSLAKIFRAFGEVAENKNIDLNSDIEFLGIKKGKYNLQTLFYDFFLKCYYKSGESQEGETRVIAQLFDWFNPLYYHQTSRSELIEMIENLDEIKNYEIISKTNGHFFKVIKK